MLRSTVTSVEGYTRVRRDAVRIDCATVRETAADDVSSLDNVKGQDEGTEAPGGRTVPVTLRFLTPSVFRFELQAVPETGGGSPNDLAYDAFATDVDIDVVERADCLELGTDALRVRIGLDPWSFAVEDADGYTLFEEQRDDRDAKENRRVDPLGFAEEQTSRWPLRVPETGTAVRLRPDEHVYGLGEKFTGLDKREQTIHSWTTQPNGCETEHAYKNVPFYLSTAGYGLLVDTGSRVDFDFGDTSTVSSSITVHDDTLAFVFFHGPSFKDILREYTELTGRADRPPKWSFGVWMSRWGYESRSELESVADRLRAEEIPCDVLHLDPTWLRDGHICDLTWDEDAFPDPERMIDRLHEDGFRLSLWENPYVPVGTEEFENAAENDYLVTDPGGDPYVLDRLSLSTYRAGIVDVTDPDAADWWAEKHRPLLEAGVDTFKVDFGEYLPRDAILANGAAGSEMRNRFPHRYQQVVRDVVEDVVGPEEAVLWTRSGWIGSQQYPVHWSGDPRPSFGAMAACLRGGLSLTLSGYQFWSCDVGGFKGTPSPILYIRWAQFGLLGMSHVRFHGTTPREPWEFGAEATDVVRRFARERYRLLPYLYSYAERASRSGLPVMRPLVLEYQDDRGVQGVDTEFMVGEELLIAPVFDESGEVSVYLPADDDWVDYWTGERYAGGQTLHREVPIDSMPVFVRAGSILPTRTPTQHVEPGTPDEVTLRVIPDTDETDASFEFYDEDHDRTTTVSVRMDADRERVDVAVGREERTGLFAVTVDDVTEAPETVAVNGTPLTRVDGTPSPGEWQYDPGARAVRIDVPP